MSFPRDMRLQDRKHLQKLHTQHLQELKQEAMHRVGLLDEELTLEERMGWTPRDHQLHIDEALRQAARLELSQDTQEAEQKRAWAAYLEHELQNLDSADPTRAG